VTDEEAHAAKLKDSLDGILIRSLTPEQAAVYARIIDLRMHMDGTHPFADELPASLGSAEALVREGLLAEELPLPRYLDG
jgi:hypothetical protein